ncbi:TerB family tellurite resistance protein [Roseospirillum parvum]|uniref:DnaJ like chaperone protein n=1 Tax=Roseospirillum parvum TaxID=83401 RepID=A0A1G7THS8_9PROT|nr:TerB family tellurite resistance protein [Roseospirillum parvum]SDG34878.1 DnaJ like chaperone protein [Roseospirillum parvum]
MGWWGKLIGGAAGMALGGPLGAGLGVAAGHAFDRMAVADRDNFGLGDDVAGEGRRRLGGVREKLENARAQARQAAFTAALVTLAAKMAKADGTVTRAEIDAFKSLFHIPPEQMSTIGRLWDTARRSTDGYQIAAAHIAREFRDSPEMLENLLGALIMIAQADGHAMAPEEIAFLEEVARIFGLPPRDFARVRAGGAPAGEGDPYQVLGVDRAASGEEIKAAWRRLTREHHPDLLAAKGMPPEFIEVATSRMAAINAAYDRIAQERGLK